MHPAITNILDFIRRRPLQIFILLTGIIIFVLYHKFILNRAVYMYNDAGSDTIDSYYPYYYHIITKIRNLDFSLFDLNSAMGINLFTYNSFSADPFTFIMALAPARYTHYSIIVAAVIKYIIIALVSYYTLKMFTKDEIAIIGGSLIYTFSSFNVLWGQHYNFLTGIVFFTIFMFLLEKIARGENIYRKYFVIHTAFFAIFSIYFLYITCVFTVLYLLCRLCIEKQNVNTIIKLELKTGLLILLALMIGAGFIWAWVSVLLESPRTTDIYSCSNLFSLFSENEYLRKFARLYGNNTLGIRNEGSYYEEIMLFTSNILLFALVALFSRKKNLLRNIIILIIAAAAICLPVLNKVIILTDRSRWSFIIIFVFVILIVRFISNLTRVKASVIILAWGINMSGLVILCLWSKRLGINLDSICLITSIIFSTLYAIILCCSKLGRTALIMSKTALIVCICCELIIVNYPTVNKRIYYSKRAFLTSTYFDGTSEACQEIAKEDKSLYRIGKDYHSKHLNDALIQEYFSLEGYSSINNRHFWNYLLTLGSERWWGGSINSNCVSIFNRTTLETLLSVKYKLRKDPVAKSDFNGYKYLKTINGISIYKNLQYLPFGYIYYKRMTLNDFTGLSNMAKDDAMLQCFYIEDSYSDVISSFPATNCTSYNPSGKDVLKIKLIDEGKIDDGTIINNADVLTQNKSLLLNPKNEDPQIIKSLPVACQGEFIRVKMDISVTDPAYMQIFWSTDNEDFSEKHSVSKLVLPQINQYIIDLPVTTVKRLRVDPVERIEKVFIKDIELNVDNQYMDFYNKAVENLRKGCLQNIKFKNSTLTGTIDNSASVPGMLCIPIPYSDGWKVKLNNQPGKIYKINGGLIGVMIGTGTCDIILNWNPVFFYPAILISIMSLLLYFVLIRVKVI